MFECKYQLLQSIVNIINQDCWKANINLENQRQSLTFKIGWNQFSSLQSFTIKIVETNNYQIHSFTARLFEINYRQFNQFQSSTTQLGENNCNQHKQFINYKQIALTYLQSSTVAGSSVHKRSSSNIYQHSIIIKGK